MPDLKRRSLESELMDAEDVDPAALEHAMGHLEVINRWLNGYGPSLSGTASLLGPDLTEFSFLDVGCGSGDTLRQVARWARRRGLKARLHGIELSGQTAQRAAELCAQYPEICVEQADFFGLSARQCFDVVHCALVLHHIPDEKIPRFLANMASLARRGIVVNDLHRNPIAYGSIWILTRLLSRSRILQNDAPLSVARSFTRAELEGFATAAGLQDVSVRWRWAFRWRFTAGPEGAA